MASQDHITLGDGGIIRCTHCGASHSPFGPTGAPMEIWAVTALYRAFGTEHAACPEPEGERCAFCHSPSHDWTGHIAATCKRAQDWPGCGDTGLSSKAIYRHMMGLGGGFSDYPFDPDDLGRCVRLLDAPWAAGWRERMGEMAARGREWAALVSVWAEIEALYRAEVGTGSAPRCYRRMRKVLGAVGG